MADADLRRRYILYMQIHAQAERGGARAGGRGDWGFGTRDPVGAAVELPHQPGESSTPAPEPLIPAIIIRTSPDLRPPLFAFDSSVGGWLFSYAAATLLTGVAILGAWLYKVSLGSGEGTPSVHIAGVDRPQSPPAEAAQDYVGRITGMADCRWADPAAAPPSDTAAVPVGRKYHLASGLMEISYDSGARVILQGPCSYEVDSTAGGFLSLGKLTARVERSEIRNPKSESSNPSSFILHPSSLFTVRTPTAIVTDLGTEFGVEVTGDRRNRVYVFEGRVAVRPAAGKKAKLGDLVLGEGQSAAADANGAVLESPPSREAEGKDSAAQFVRRMPLPAKLGVLDLLDIVAGGDGMGQLREVGIEAATGNKDATFPAPDEYRNTDRRYHRVPWNRLVDGVFIPDGKLGPVQLDSAGHSYALPATTGQMNGPIWRGRRRSRRSMPP